MRFPCRRTVLERWEAGAAIDASGWRPVQRPKARVRARPVIRLDAPADSPLLPKTLTLIPWPTGCATIAMRERAAAPGTMAWVVSYESKMSRLRAGRMVPFERPGVGRSENSENRSYNQNEWDDVTAIQLVTLYLFGSGRWSLSRARCLLGEQRSGRHGHCREHKDYLLHYHHLFYLSSGDF